MTTQEATTAPRHHGFTCPRCGSHYFGSGTVYPKMEVGLPVGTKYGHCNAHSHTGNGCTFKWDRDDPKAEAECMYHQTPEEWAASFHALRSPIAAAA